MKRRALLAAASVSSAVVAGCQGLLSEDDSRADDGGGDDPENGDEGESSDGTDEEFSIGTSAAPPGTIVELSGVPGSAGDEPIAWCYDAAIDDPGEDDRTPVFVDVDEERFFVPPHPGDAMGGGPVEIEILDEDGEEIVKGGIEFTIEALEPAPGTLTDTVDEVESTVTDVAGTFGYDADQLVGVDPEEFPPPVDGIAAALQTIDGDGETIRSLLNGESEHFDDGDETGIEFADAIANESGFSTAILDAVGAMNNLDAPPTDGAGGSESAARAAPADGERAREPEDRSGPDGLDSISWSDGHDRIDRAESRLVGQGDPVVVDSPSIDSVEDLEYWMDVQARFANANDGAAALSRDLGGVVVAGCALVPGGQGAAAVGSATLWITNLLIALAENQLPSTLDIELEGDPTDYNEDDGSTGTLSATVEGHSEGFTYTWPSVLGDVPGAGVAARVTSRFGRQASRMVDFDENLLKFLQTSMSATWNQLEDDGPIDFPPGIYGPVDVDPHTDGPFLEVDFETIGRETSQDPFSFDALDLEYEPEAVGKATVTMRPDEDRFGGATASDLIELTVHPIEVNIEDATDGTRLEIIRLDPDEDALTLQLRAIVENAENDDLEWHHEVIAGPAIPAPAPASGDPPEATVDLSGVDFSGYEQSQYVIEVEAVTEEGARADLEPPRRDRVTILVTDEDEELVVGPNPGCLAPDETHGLSFTLDGEPVDLADLTWSIEGDGDGDITPNGTFVPSAAGLVELEFWLDDDRDVSDRLGFVVSEDCNELYVELRDGHSTFSHTYNCIDSHGFGGDRQESMSQISTHPERWTTGATIETRIEIPYVFLPELPLDEPLRVSGIVHMNAEYPDGRTDSTSFGTIVDRIPMTITRRIVPEGALDGSDLQVFDGEFGPYEGHGAGGYATIEGHFTGVGWMEDRCGGFLVGPP